MLKGSVVYSKPKGLNVKHLVKAAMMVMLFVGTIAGCTPKDKKNGDTPKKTGEAPVPATDISKTT